MTHLLKKRKIRTTNLLSVTCAGCRSICDIEVDNLAGKSVYDIECESFSFIVCLVCSLVVGELENLTTADKLAVFTSHINPSVVQYSNHPNTIPVSPFISASQHDHIIKSEIPISPQQNEKNENEKNENAKCLVDEGFKIARSWFNSADAVLIVAGAGMSAESGLSTFRYELAEYLQQGIRDGSNVSDSGPDSGMLEDQSRDTTAADTADAAAAIANVAITVATGASASAGTATGAATGAAVINQSTSADAATGATTASTGATAIAVTTAATVVSVSVPLLGGGLSTAEVCYQTRPEKAWYYDASIRRDSLAHSPHNGYQILLNALQKQHKDFRVLTSNIDHYFIRAEYPPETVYETHGSIDLFQCAKLTDSGRCMGVWKWGKNPDPILDDILLECDVKTTPLCPQCGGCSRANISHEMDGAEDLDYTVKGGQKKNLWDWLRTFRKSSNHKNTSRKSGKYSSSSSSSSGRSSNSNNNSSSSSSSSSSSTNSTNTTAATATTTGTTTTGTTTTINTAATPTSTPPPISATITSATETNHKINTQHPTNQPKKFLIIEIGCGSTIHGLRQESELLLSAHPVSGVQYSKLIRINPDLNCTSIRPIDENSHNNYSNADNKANALMNTDNNRNTDDNKLLHNDNNRLLDTDNNLKYLDPWGNSNRIFEVKSSALTAIIEIFKE